MVNILDPQEQQQMPPQAMQAIQKAKQEAVLNETCKVYEQKIQQLEFEKAAQVVENEAKLEIEKMKAEVDVRAPRSRPRRRA
jgi:predicted nucleic acid-binding protein